MFDVFLYLVCEEQGGLYFSFSHACWADFHDLHLNGWSDSLSCDLHESELAERQHIMPCAVSFHEFAHMVVELLLVLFGVHVDEVHDDDSADVSESELVRQFIRSEHVELVCVFLLVLEDFLASGVDIDGKECFRLVDDEVSSVFESDDSSQARLHLSSDVKLVKDRLCPLVEFHNFRAFGRDEFQILSYFVVNGLVVDLYGCEVGRQDISDDTDSSTNFLTYEADGFFFLERFYGFFPSLQEQSEFVVEFCCPFVFCNGSNDNAESLGFDRKEQLFES